MVNSQNVKEANGENHPKFLYFMKNRGYRLCFFKCFMARKEQKKDGAHLGNHKNISLKLKRKAKCLGGVSSCLNCLILRIKQKISSLRQCEVRYFKPNEKL